MNLQKTFLTFIFVAASSLAGVCHADGEEYIKTISSNDSLHIHMDFMPSWAGSDNKTHDIFTISFSRGRIRLLKHESFNNLVLEVIPENQAWQGIGRIVTSWRPNQLHAIDIGWQKDGLGRAYFSIGIDGKKAAGQKMIFPSGQVIGFQFTAEEKPVISNFVIDNIIPKFLDFPSETCNANEIPVPTAYVTPVLHPAPKKMIRHDYSVSYRGGLVIRCDSRLEDTAEFFAECMKNRYGVPVECIRRDASAKKDGLEVELCVDDKYKAKSSEAYTLSSSEGKIKITAGAAEGVFRGVQTLRKIMADGDEIAMSFQGVEITDYPDLPVRGHYVEAMWSGLNVENFKKVIDAASLAGINMMFIDHGSTFEYKSVPGLKCAIKGIAQNTPEEIRELRNYAARRGITLAPALRCFSHAEWFTKSFPELKENGPHKIGGLENYCPSNPETYKLLFGIIDDLLAAYDYPGKMHIGEDEHFHANIGVCEKCRKKSYGRLVGEDIAKIASYLKSKSTQTYIYNDMITPPQMWNQTDGDVNAVESIRGRTAKQAEIAAAILPKDIAITYWYYGTDEKNFDGAEYLHKQGFPLFPMPWKNPDNIKLAADYAGKLGGYGIIGSSWSADWRYLPDTTVWNALIYSADTAWNISPENSLSWSAAETGNRFMELSSTLDKIDFDAIVPLKFPHRTGNKPAGNWLNVANGINPASVYPQEKIATLRQIKFTMPSNDNDVIVITPAASPKSNAPQTVKFNIPVNRKLSHIFFLQSCGLILAPNPTGKIPFRYTIRYSDGTSVTLPQRIGFEIDTCFTSATLPYAKVAYHKTLKKNTPVQMYIFTWKNPSPDKKIDSLEIAGSDVQIKNAIPAISILPSAD